MTADIKQAEVESLAKDANPDAVPRVTKHVLWSGGFDSTAIILRHLRNGHAVQPYYMMHSAGWAKCTMEIATQERIREFMGNPSNLYKPIFWNYDQLQLVPGAKLLLDTTNELADALHLSHQYSAIRFCRDIVGHRGQLELGVVRYDELWTNWERIRGDDAFGGPLKKFFKDFEFPVWDKMKRDLWDENSPMEREVLKRTFSCEKSDGENRSCVQRGVVYKDQCSPCQHRIPEAM